MTSLRRGHGDPVPDRADRRRRQPAPPPVQRGCRGDRPPPAGQVYRPRRGQLHQQRLGHEPAARVLPGVPRLRRPRWRSSPPSPRSLVRRPSVAVSGQLEQRGERGRPVRRHGPDRLLGDGDRGSRHVVCRWLGHRPGGRPGVAAPDPRLGRPGQARRQPGRPHRRGRRSSSSDRGDIFTGQDFRIDVSSEAGNRFDQNITGFRAEEEFGFNAEPYVRTGKFLKVLGL